jgi:hypothetical protein
MRRYQTEPAATSDAKRNVDRRLPVSPCRTPKQSTASGLFLLPAAPARRCRSVRLSVRRLANWNHRPQSSYAARGSSNDEPDSGVIQITAFGQIERDKEIRKSAAVLTC